MNDHNLDDLIIDTIAPKNKKTKSLLTIIALLIIVLIVAIILTKTLLKSPETNELSFEENMSNMIAPELQLQVQEEVKVTEVSKPKKDLSLSHIMEEKTTAPENVQKTVQKAEVEPKVQEEISKPIEINKEVAPVKVAEETTTPIEVVKKKPLPTPPSETIVKKPTKPTKPTVSNKRPKPTKVVKKEPKKPLVKPIKKQTVQSQAPQTNTTGKYYVQVSSFKSATPSNRLLSVIKSSGFSSHITDPDRTGYKKLLIGPYKTRADVDKARDIVRDRILKSAFVVER